MTDPAAPVRLTISRADADLIHCLWHDGIESEVEGLMERLWRAIEAAAPSPPGDDSTAERRRTVFSRAV